MGLLYFASHSKHFFKKWFTYNAGGFTHSPCLHTENVWFLPSSHSETDLYKLLRILTLAKISWLTSYTEIVVAEQRRHHESQSGRPVIRRSFENKKRICDWAYTYQTLLHRLRPNHNYWDKPPMLPHIVTTTLSHPYFSITCTEPMENISIMKFRHHFSTCWLQTDPI